MMSNLTDRAFLPWTPCRVMGRREIAIGVMLPSARRGETKVGKGRSIMVSSKVGEGLQESDFRCLSLHIIRGGGIRRCVGQHRFLLKLVVLHTSMSIYTRNKEIVAGSMMT